METFLLLAQLALTAAGFGLLWRRLETLQGEVGRLREAVDALQSRKAAPRAAIAATAAAPSAEISMETPHARAARAWRLPSAEQREGGGAWKAPPLNVLQGAALSFTAIAPALGFLVEASAGAVATAGLIFAAAMSLIALHPQWRIAGWTAVASATIWAVLGIALGAPNAPLLFSTGIAVVGVAGLAHAVVRDTAIGAALTLIAVAAALFMANAVGIVGPAGAALGAITIGAALVGAASLRLEAFHLGAFALALLVLFVLSGQPEAAIWFTPASAWAGALFLGIAAVRVPVLGARGVALAGAGALAPLAVIFALYGARHALESRYAAAAAFAALSVALIAILYVAAQRRERGLNALGLTTWVLAAGASVSMVAAVLIALLAPFAASACASLALAFMATNFRWPHPAWRVLACLAGLLSALMALVSLDLHLNSAPWPTWSLIAFALAAPASLSAAAAHFAKRAKALGLHIAFDLLALTFLIGGLHLATRLVFAGEAAQLRPIGFPEAGTHISIWLAGALLTASAANKGPRMAAAMTLAAPALAAFVLASALWLSPFWSLRAEPLSAPQPLGFLLPAFLFGVHWAFWRARGSNVRTRLAFAAGVLATASALTLWLNQSEDVPEWIGALASALAFASAIALNFAPGVTQSEGRRGYLVDQRRKV